MASTDGELMTLRVRRTAPAEVEHTLSVLPTATLSSFNEQLSVVCGVPVEAMRLIFRGHILADRGSNGDALSLASHGLEDGHVIHLVTRAVGTGALRAKGVPMRWSGLPQPSSE